MSQWRIGIMGGSGLYQIDALQNPAWIAVDTPFGDPSDQILAGRIGDVDLVFLPRHGRGHRHSPNSINYRANIWALKSLGCTDILSVSAVGSLREELAPGTFVLVDQFIDRTRNRISSFFETGLVGHVSMAQPVCARLAGLAGDAARNCGVKTVMGGTYLAMDGPQFSSLAESRLYRQWGCDVIGMTNMPEAKLAREAELPYASIAMITDYDCWHSEIEAVSVENVLKIMAQNSDRARELIVELVTHLPVIRTPSPQAIETVLDYSLIPAPEARDGAVIERLAPILRRVLGRTD